MHEQAARTVGHERGVDLIRGERLQSLLPLGFLAHARPDVGVDDGGSPHGRDRVGRFRNVGFRQDCLQVPTKGGVKLILLRGGEHEPHAQQTADHGQRSCHVVAIADEGHGESLHAAHLLPQRVDVGERLAGMRLVRQPVDHRHARHLGQSHDRFMGLRAADDRIDVFAEHAAEIGDALPRRCKPRVGTEKQARATEVRHRGLKADPRPQALLLEHERQHAAGQERVATARNELLLEVARDRKHGLNLGRGQVFGNDEMPERHDALVRRRRGTPPR